MPEELIEYIEQQNDFYYSGILVSSRAQLILNNFTYERLMLRS